MKNFDIQVASFRTPESGGSNVWDAQKQKLISLSEYIKYNFPGKNGNSDNIKNTFDDIKNTFDVILITAEAFVDHPSFGTAVIARVLQKNGFKTAIICQPDLSSKENFSLFGKPNLFFGITAGTMDSLVRFYTPFLNPRKKDAYSENSTPINVCYTPCAAYSGAIRSIWKDSMIVLGGIEASLRKTCHYDFKRDTLRESILAWSGADLLVYGSGEKPIIKIAEIVRKIVRKKEQKIKKPIEKQNDKQNFNLNLKDDLKNNLKDDLITLKKKLYSIKGTSFMLTRKTEDLFVSNDRVLALPSFKEIKQNSSKLIKNELMLLEVMAKRDITLVQDQLKNKIVINPPTPAGSTEDLDAIYELPFTRRVAPNYTGLIKACEMIKNSITTHRGCFGSCSFCAIAVHQGRRIISRSTKSILKELTQIANDPDFKGVISDIGGPSANMFGSTCRVHKNSDQRCPEKKCIGTNGICKHLNSGQKEWLLLLKQARKIKNIKKIFVSSGLRFDMIMDCEQGHELFEYLLLNCTSGILKVAPEHIDNRILKLVNKPDNIVFQRFCALFDKIKKENNLNYYMLPYLITSLPGADQQADARLSNFVKKDFGAIEQIQTFTPTPGTLSTAMWYAVCDESGHKIPIIKDKAGRLKIRRTFINDNAKKNKKRASKFSKKKTKNR